MQALVLGVYYEIEPFREWIQGDSGERIGELIK